MRMSKPKRYLHYYTVVVRVSDPFKIARQIAQTFGVIEKR